MKIYSDDPNLPYKTTKLKALYTKSEIDGLFAKWGVKDVYWHWDPGHNDIFVQFKIAEEIDGVLLQVSAKVEAPSIWEHRTRSKAEGVNWDISMLVMYWFIKSHLEAAYLLQSSKTAAFLPYIASKDGAKVLKDILIPRMNEIRQLAGFLASVSRPVDVGDAVVFNEDFCFVEDITLMQTILRTWDNRRLIVPNSTLFSEVITNYTKRDPAMLAPLFVTITYESNLDKAIEILVDEAKKHPDCSPIGDLPNVVVMDYTERGIKLRLLSRAKDQPTTFKMSRDLLYSIKKRFDAEGIALAPPRTYVTFD